MTHAFRRTDKNTRLYVHSAGYGREYSNLFVVVMFNAYGPSVVMMPRGLSQQWR